MLIECEVWVPAPGEVEKGGCKWGRQRKERAVIDTDLYEWFGADVVKRECEWQSLYPYPNQRRVPHRYKNGYLTIDEDVLSKIRKILSEGKVVVI